MSGQRRLAKIFFLIAGLLMLAAALVEVMVGTGAVISVLLGIGGIIFILLSVFLYRQRQP
jgi:hypothetical protein